MVYNPSTGSPNLRFPSRHMEAFSAKVDAWAARYIESERLPSLAVAIVRRGGEVVFRKGYSSGVQSLTPVEAGGDNE